ncbi:MAG: nucleotidyl transferase AbiEii/AbiGii toxin family protein [Planctomycetes bacterium]|nr:nucleotidyl transferase AbiEii/AbiGii toxin family protein [Planctomycetota bacterium]
MRTKRSITRLPANLHTSLLLLERGYFFCNGGALSNLRFPEKVAAFLNRLAEAGVDWVLVGAEAVNLYLKNPRATVDIDIVVRQKDLRKVKKILKESCSSVKDTEVHFQGVLAPEPGKLTVDVIKSQSHKLFEAALDRKIEVEGIQAPPVEVVLALKFFSAVSPWRSRTDKLQDLTDFMRAFKDNKDRLNRTLLVDLASMAHKNARAEFEQFLDAVEHDKPITV